MVIKGGYLPANVEGYTFKNHTLLELELELG